jgi:hypothetical protein
MDFGNLIHFIGLIIFYIRLRIAGTGPSWLIIELSGTGSTVFKQTLFGARNFAITRTFYIFSLDAYALINR